MDMARILDAARFAARAHRGQTRKGAGDVPYVDHVLEVAARLAAVHPEDDVLIVAGLLHDTVEDCDVGRDDLVRTFGEEVAALVMEVTDDKSLPKAERKAAQEREVLHLSDRAKRLKMADKTSNVLTLVDGPPDWPVPRQTEYVDWACRVIDPIRELDARLAGEFYAAVAEARAAIAARAR
jgi:(p)ppGpp synthase/HD superfamily hydrolase